MKCFVPTSYTQVKAHLSPAGPRHWQTQRRAHCRSHRLQGQRARRSVAVCVCVPRPPRPNGSDERGRRCGSHVHIYDQRTCQRRP